MKQNYLNVDNLIVEKPKDKRFTFFKYKNKLLKLSHSEQIKLMIINNLAHKLYLSDKLKYNAIIDYIMSNISNNPKNVKFKNFESILKFIELNNDYYRANV